MILSLMLSATLVIVPASDIASQAQPDSTLLQRGLARYARNRLSEALPLLDSAARAEDGSRVALVWYAETARRLGKIVEAVRAARQVLAVEPCNSFAHEVLGATYNPSYGGWQGSNSDSTWAHLLKATECDPGDGNAWLWLWTEAIHQKDAARENQSLRRLTETGFIAPSFLALNRWVLTTLPPRAIVLTAGDLDTYPALALQLTESLRPDVAIVNLSLLNLPWYVRHVVDRYSLPSPLESDVLDHFEVREDSSGSIYPLSDEIVAAWRRMAVAGTLGRPLTIAFSAGETAKASGELGALRVEGRFRRVVPFGTTDTLDVERAGTALQGLDGKSFSGPQVSEGDRSPIRRALSGQPGLVPLYLATLEMPALLDRGRADEARALFTWAETFAVTAGLDPARTAPLLDPMRAALRK